MNFVPIHVIFTSEERTIPISITETRNVMIKARFKTSYRKGKPYKRYLGDGYVGNRYNNARI